MCQKYNYPHISFTGIIFIGRLFWQNGRHGSMLQVRQTILTPKVAQINLFKSHKSSKSSNYPKTVINKKHAVWLIQPPPPPAPNRANINKGTWFILFVELVFGKSISSTLRRFLLLFVPFFDVFIKSKLWKLN